MSLCTLEVLASFADVPFVAVDIVASVQHERLESVAVVYALLVA